jgi:hypothetical protein
MTMNNRQGTVLKKCRCATKTRCAHGWTARYWLEGKQRERTFRDEPGKPGSGKRLAGDYLLKLAHDKRAGDVTFHTAGASETFIETARAWVEAHPEHCHPCGAPLHAQAHRGGARA